MSTAQLRWLLNNSAVYPCTQVHSMVYSSHVYNRFNAPSVSTHECLLAERCGPWRDSLGCTQCSWWDEWSPGPLHSLYQPAFAAPARPGLQIHTVVSQETLVHCSLMMSHQWHQYQWAHLWHLREGQLDQFSVSPKKQTSLMELVLPCTVPNVWTRTVVATKGKTAAWTQQKSSQSGYAIVWQMKQSENILFCSLGSVMQTMVVPQTNIGSALPFTVFWSFLTARLLPYYVFLYQYMSPHTHPHPHISFRLIVTDHKRDHSRGRSPMDGTPLYGLKTNSNCV